MNRPFVAESRHVEVRSIGVFTRPEVLDYWRDRVGDLSAVRHHGIQVVSCPDVDALQRLHPEAIIAHESTPFAKYLHSNPSGLLWVQFLSSGLDRTLGVLERGERPFRITSVRGIHGAAMAEYVLAGILHFEKGIDRIRKAQSETRWERFTMRLMAGRRMVILGAGAVSGAVARAARALGLAVVAVATTARRHPDFDRVVEIDSWTDELAGADYLVLAAPLTDSTRGLVNRLVLSQIRPGGLLINLSRGELVDEGALLDALENGGLGGAVLDAFREEPLPPHSPLWCMEKILITPHIAGRFEGGHDLALVQIESNLRALVEGGALAGEVFPARGY